MDDGQIWTKVMQVFVLLLGGGATVEILRAIFGKRQARATATDVITQAAQRAVGVQDDVIERLQQTVQALVLESDSLKRENAALRIEIAELRTLVARLERALGARQDDGR